MRHIQHSDVILQRHVVMQCRVPADDTTVADHGPFADTDPITDETILADRHTSIDHGMWANDGSRTYDGIAYHDRLTGKCAAVARLMADDRKWMHSDISAQFHADIDTGKASNHGVLSIVY